MCPPTRRRRRGFTLIELLVVIAIISILAAMLLPAISLARELGRQARCKGHLRDLYAGCQLYVNNHGDTRWPPIWITQLADLGYMGDMIDANGRRPSDSGYDANSIPETKRRSSLFCPSDGTTGADGGRPNTLFWGQSDGTPELVDQYPRADVDAHDPSPAYDEGASDATLEGADTVPCSYLYEFNGELCDWIHDYHTAPTENEFQGVNWGGWDGFVRIVDQNGDLQVSWYEIKTRTITGWSAANLQPYSVSKVPYLRCYWHTGGRKRLTGRSKIISVRADGNANVGTPEWYKD